MIYDEVPPLCHALGPTISWSSPGGCDGVVGWGSLLPVTVYHLSAHFCGRKIPIDRRHQRRNAGTAWGPDLAKMRIRALVLEGHLQTQTSMQGL